STGGRSAKNCLSTPVSLVRVSIWQYCQRVRWVIVGSLSCACCSSRSMVSRPFVAACNGHTAGQKSLAGSEFFLRLLFGVSQHFEDFVSVLLGAPRPQAVDGLKLLDGLRGLVRDLPQ